MGRFTLRADARLGTAVATLGLAAVYLVAGGTWGGAGLALATAYLAWWARLPAEPGASPGPGVNVLPGESEDVRQLLATFAGQLADPHQDMAQVRQIIADAAAQLAGSFTKLNSLIHRQQSDLQGVLSEMQGSEDTAVVTVGSLAADIAENAQLLGRLAQLIVQLSKRSMDIFDQVENTAARLQEVNKLVDDVKSIADQTTLLALNAAIEAARVGEMGRGFEVVAGEVRQLAQRSKRVSEQIRGRVGEACGAVDAALRLTQENAAQDLTALLEARARLEQLSSGATQLENALRENISAVSDHSMEISQENAVAVRSLQFEDIARQILERTGQDLTDLQEVILSLPPQSSSGDLASLAQALIAEKHARAAHKPSQASVTAGEVELF